MKKSYNNNYQTFQGRYIDSKEPKFFKLFVVSSSHNTLTFSPYFHLIFTLFHLKSPSNLPSIFAYFMLDFTHFHIFPTYLFLSFPAMIYFPFPLSFLLKRTKSPTSIHAILLTLYHNHFPYPIYPYSTLLLTLYLFSHLFPTPHVLL